MTRSGGLKRESDPPPGDAPARRLHFLEPGNVLTASELERELKTLHGLALRLQPPLNERPHIFHEQKHALAEAIAGLLTRCGFAPPSSPRSFSARQRDLGLTLVRVGWRAIPVERRRL